MADVNEALKQFEATEANLVKLEQIWKELTKLMPLGIVVQYSPEQQNKYEILSRRFERIRTVMPHIDGYNLVLQRELL